MTDAAVIPPARSLRQTAITGAVWLIVQNGGGRAIAFLSQLVIAAILSPGDFGVIGLAYTVSTFGAILVNFGSESVLLQRQRTLQFWVVPAFWHSLGLGMLAFGLVAAAGPVAARIYHLPAVAPLSLLIAAGIPLAALATVPSVLLKARFQFRHIAAIGLGETLLIQGLTIAFAWHGFGPASFALPLPIAALLRTTAMWSLTRPDLSGLFRKARRVRFLLGNSAAVFATGAIQTAISQGDYVVLGILGSDTAVGLYFFAFKMASQPLLLMAMSLGNVLLPTLSNLRSTPVAQADAALRAARLLGLLIMPLAFLQAALIEPAVHLFFAAKWDASIPLMQILSVALGFDAIAWIAAALLTAQGGFRRQLGFVAASAPPFFAAVAIGGWNGSALGVAIAVAAYYAVVSPLYTYAVFRRTGTRPATLLRVYLLPAATAAVAFGTAAALAALLPAAPARMAAVIAVGLPLHVGLLRLADPAGFAEVSGILRSLLRGRRG